MEKKKMRARWKERTEIQKKNEEEKKRRRGEEGKNWNKHFC